MAQHPGPSAPRKGTESSRVAAGTERGSPAGESPGLKLLKGYIPRQHREMLPAWIAPDSALEKRLQPLGCYQTTGDILPVTSWTSPIVTSCTQPDAQGH